MLGGILNAKFLRICSVFPTALTAADRPGEFVHAYRDTPERDRWLAAEVERTEVPGLAVRNGLRALYNSHLRRLCRDRGLVLVDAFSPFVRDDSTTDSRFLAEPGDFHLSYDGIEEVLIGLIWRHVRDGNPATREVA
jgi:hypothetical protein